MGGGVLVLCVGGPPPPWRARGGARSGSAYPAVLSGRSFHALRSTEGPRGAGTDRRSRLDGPRRIAWFRPRRSPCFRHRGELMAHGHAEAAPRLARYVSDHPGAPPPSDPLAAPEGLHAP